jgi:hypothetical protein
MGLDKLSSPNTRTSRIIDEKRGIASTGGSVSPATQCNEAYASTEAKSRGPKIGIITKVCYIGQTPME